MGSRQSVPSPERGNRKTLTARFRSFINRNNKRKPTKNLASEEIINNTVGINSSVVGESVVTRISVKEEDMSSSTGPNTPTTISPTKNPTNDKSIPPASPMSNYKHTEGQVRRIQITDSEYECTEICSYLYVGGAKVAQSWNVLETLQITHVINCAGSVIPNYFESKSGMVYLSLNMVDGRDDDISWFVCEVVHFIYNAMLQGRKMLLHCEKGISRSCSLAIAYHMWSTRSSWKQSFNFIKSRRVISNPNTAFTCNLIEIDEMINGDGKYQDIMFRCARHLTNDNTPVLKLCRHPDSRKILRPSSSLLDQKGVFVIRSSQNGSCKIIIWQGKYAAPDSLTVTYQLAQKMFDVFAKADSTIVVVRGGQETDEFYEHVARDDANSGDKPPSLSFNDLWGIDLRPQPLNLPSIKTQNSDSKSRPLPLGKPAQRLPPLSASSGIYSLTARPGEFLPIDGLSAQGSSNATPNKDNAFSRTTSLQSESAYQDNQKAATRYIEIPSPFNDTSITRHDSFTPISSPRHPDSLSQTPFVTPSRPSSGSWLKSPTYNQKLVESPQSQTPRNVVPLRGLESATQSPVVNDDAVQEAMVSLDFFSQRPEMTSLVQQDSLSDAGSSADSNSSALSNPRPDLELPAPASIVSSVSVSRRKFSNPKRLKKPYLYQAQWNSFRDVYEWQALGVYDDDDLIESSALLLICPSTPHYLWVGSEFDGLQEQLKTCNTTTEDVVFSHWACHDVDMSQLQQDRRITYLLPLSRLDVKFERGSQESDAFWNSFTSGY